MVICSISVKTSSDGGSSARKSFQLSHPAVAFCWRFWLGFFSCVFSVFVCLFCFYNNRGRNTSVYTTKVSLGYSLPSPSLDTLKNNYCFVSNWNTQTALISTSLSDRLMYLNISTALVRVIRTCKSFLWIFVTVRLKLCSLKSSPTTSFVPLDSLALPRSFPGTRTRYQVRRPCATQTFVNPQLLPSSLFSYFLYSPQSDEVQHYFDLTLLFLLLEVIIYTPWWF